MTSHRAAAVEALPHGLTIIGSRTNVTNVDLVHKLQARGIDSRLVAPRDALRTLGRGDLALGRLDVLPTLDGIESGLLALLWLERRGVRLLNRSSALLAVHDKLRTAHILRAAGLPHPRTLHVTAPGQLPEWSTPFVLKPRFGSWGRDVFRCADCGEGSRVLAAIRERPWFRRHGVLAQELLPLRGRDLRLIVAGAEVVGAAVRVGAPGEWRTNVSLGGSLEPADPRPAAEALARAAAAATGADVVGVDLLPVDDGYAVLELNGAVEFDERYSIRGCDFYEQLARALALRMAVRPTAVGSSSTGGGIH